MWEGYVPVVPRVTRVSVDKFVLAEIGEILQRIPCDDSRCKGARSGGWVECHSCAARRKASFLDIKEIQP